MLNETWKEQYDRMQRSFALLKQIGEPTALPQDVIPARDVLYHFCSDAFHLRDWIAATVGTDPNSRKTAAAQLDTEVIKPSPELSACRDIANGFKHLVLDGPSYVTGTNQGHSEVVSHSINIGVPPTQAVASMHASASVTHPDGTVDADPAEPPPPPAPAPASSSGYIQDTFKIDINGQPHDVRDVATKAVAAWDQWLAGTSPMCCAAAQHMITGFKRPALNLVLRVALADVIAWTNRATRIAPPTGLSTTGFGNPAAPRRRRRGSRRPG